MTPRAAQPRSRADLHAALPEADALVVESMTIGEADLAAVRDLGGAGVAVHVVAADGSVLASVSS